MKQNSYTDFSFFLIVKYRSKNAPSICSLDVGFFDKGATTNNFAQIQKQYLSPMSLRICLSELAMQDIMKLV
jgi:hypothetical protein